MDDATTGGVLGRGLEVQDFFLHHVGIFLFLSGRRSSVRQNNEQIFHSTFESAERLPSSQEIEIIRATVATGALRAGGSPTHKRAQNRTSAVISVSVKGGARGVHVRIFAHMDQGRGLGTEMERGLLMCTRERLGSRGRLRRAAHRRANSPHPMPRSAAERRRSPTVQERPHQWRNHHKSA